MVEEERGSAGKEANTTEGRWWVVYRRIHSTRERTAKRIRGTRGSGWSSAKSRVLLSVQFLKGEKERERELRRRLARRKRVTQTGNEDR